MIKEIQGSQSSLLTTFNKRQMEQKSNYSSQPTVVNSVDTAAKENVIPAKNKEIIESKQFLYVTSAVALASLGVAGVSLIKGHKSPKINDILAKTQEQIKGLIDPLVDVMNKKTDDLASGFRTSIDETENKLVGKIDELGKWQDGQISGVRSELGEQITDLGKWQDGQIKGVEEKFNNRIAELPLKVGSKGSEFTANIVNINGKDLELAGVLHGYGSKQWEMEKALRSEAAKRIFGAVDRSNKLVPDEVMIRVPTSEYKDFTSTGGMSIVPKEIIANLAGMINNKQKAQLFVDTPMYLGEVSNNHFYNLVKKVDGSFEYVNNIRGDKHETKILATLEQIDTMRLPIYTDTGISQQEVKIFRSNVMEAPIDYNLLKPRLDKDVLASIEDKIAKGESYDNGVFRVDAKKVVDLDDPNKITYVPKGAVAKYRAILYKNEKFDMAGPVYGNKNIYNNQTHTSGETERQVYLGKFFYEHLLRNQESSSVPLRADLIIGNDWQTGPITAMIRQLTTAKKHFGLDPVLADKIHDTPVVTLFHNAALTGEVWHSQAKLLNIMYGEHATAIVKNSWMPQNCNINPKLLNGMFNGENLNPQTMAAAYSDLVVPVSKGYSNEISTHSGFGGANHDIFKIRGRMFEFGDEQHIKYLAKQNDLNPEFISKDPTSVGITNGCDRVNNILYEKNARSLEKALGLDNNSLRVFKDGDDVAQWHNHNKNIYLNKVIKEIDMARTTNGQKNPMKISLPEHTDLTGVTVDTPVFSTAGRIVDQKGLDIFAESIEEFLLTYKGDNPPVFYAQGVGDEKFIKQMLDIKKRVAQTNPQAAKRIVFANLFSETGRYDGCKLMSDFTIMSSWFEPCGLVHKEIAPFSGSISVVNEVGGLVDGLINGKNAVFAKFKPKHDGYDEAIAHNRKSFAEAMNKAYDWFMDKEQFNKGLKASFEAQHSWLKKDGPMDQYAHELVKLKVLKSKVLEYNELS